MMDENTKMPEDELTQGKADTEADTPEAATENAPEVPETATEGTTEVPAMVEAQWTPMEGETPAADGAEPAAELPVPMPAAAPKKKTGLILAVAAVVLVLTAVAGFAFVSNNPKRVVNRALSAAVAASAQQMEQSYADFPVMGRQMELVQGSHKKDFSLTLNSINITDISPLVSALLSGIKVEGSTTVDPVAKSCQNNYSMAMLGQKIGPVELYTSPTELAVAMPDYFSKAYTVNLDELAATGAQSFLFGTAMQMEQEELTALVDNYQGILGYMDAMEPQQAMEMGKQMEALLLEGLKNAEYGAVKVEGKRQYTVTVPAADLKTTVEAAFQYIYVDSAMGKSVAGLLPEAQQGEYAATMQEAIAKLVAELPEAPLVLTMDIKGNRILATHVVLDGAAQPNEVMVDMTLLTPEDKISSIDLTVAVGPADNRQELTMAMERSIKDQRMLMKLDMQMGMGKGVGSLDMQMNLSLDSKQTHDNLNLGMTYTVQVSGPPSSPPDEVVMTVGGVGDYIIEGEGVVLDLRELTVGINLPDQMELQTNLSMRTATNPYTQALAAPVGVDILKMGQPELETINSEWQAAMEKLLAPFFKTLFGDAY